MSPPLPKSLLLFALAISANADDLLQFTNNDRLLGTFSGFNESSQALWKRDGIQETLTVSPNQLKRIVINDGYANQFIDDQSCITLISSEKIPGQTISLDKNSATVSSEIFGELIISRENISKATLETGLSRHLYFGPFSEEKWKQFPELSRPNEKEKPAKWLFTGTSWESKNASPLYADLDLPEQSSLTFKMKWLTSPHLTIAVNCDSDLAKRAEQKNLRETQGQRRHHFYFGTTLCISITGNNIFIKENTMSPQGVPISERLHHSQTNLTNDRQKEAIVQINTDTQKKRYVISINGVETISWQAAENTKFSNGNSIGFVNTYGNNEVSISDITLKSWSQKSTPPKDLGDQQGYITLNDDQGRLHARNVKIEAEEVHFDTQFGKMSAPLKDLHDIFFRKAEDEVKSKTSDNVTFSFFPFGFIDGRVVGSDTNTISIEHEILGPMKLQKAYISSILFQNPEPSK